MLCDSSKVKYLVLISALGEFGAAWSVNSS